MTISFKLTLTLDDAWNSRLVLFGYLLFQSILLVGDIQDEYYCNAKIEIFQEGRLMRG